MSENKFWLTIWLGAMVSVVIIVLLFCTYYTGKNEMITKSTDPIATACAMNISDPVQYTTLCQEKARK